MSSGDIVKIKIEKESGMFTIIQANQRIVEHNEKRTMYNSTSERAHYYECLNLEAVTTFKTIFYRTMSLYTNRRKLRHT